MKFSVVLAVVLAVCFVVAQAQEEDSLKKKDAFSAAYEKAVNAESAFEQKECIFNFNMQKMQSKQKAKAELDVIADNVKNWQAAQDELRDLMEKYKQIDTDSRNTTTVETVRRAGILLKEDFLEYQRKIENAVEHKKSVEVELAAVLNDSMDRYCSIPVYIRTKVMEYRMSMDDIKGREVTIANAVHRQEEQFTKVNQETEDLIQLKSRIQEILEKAITYEQKQAAVERIEQISHAIRKARLARAVQKATLNALKSKREGEEFVRKALTCALQNTLNNTMMSAAEYLVDDFVAKTHALGHKFVFETESLGEFTIQLSESDENSVSLGEDLAAVEKEIKIQETISDMANKDLGSAKNAGETFLAQDRFDKSEIKIEKLRRSRHILKAKFLEAEAKVLKDRKLVEDATVRQNDAADELRDTNKRATQLRADIAELYRVKDLNAPKKEFKPFDGAASFLNTDSEEKSTAKQGVEVYGDMASSVNSMLQTDSKATTKTHVAAAKPNGNGLYKAKIVDPKADQIQIPRWMLTDGAYEAPWFHGQIVQLAI